MTVTLRATMPDRRTVELAIEHLVQDHGLDRDAIAIEPVGAENTVGERVSGADADSGYPGLPADPDEAAVNGAIYVTVDVDDADADAAEKAFEAAGATDVQSSRGDGS